MKECELRVTAEACVGGVVEAAFRMSNPVRQRDAWIKRAR